MYRGRSQRTGGRGGSNYSRGRSARGLFKDNIWYCDCEPQRLPAEHFKVKKEGKNKGRWFYTCQQEESKRCGFFLWDEDAEPRMQSAVLNGPGAVPDNTRRASDQVGWNAGRSAGTEEPIQGRGLFASSNRPHGRDAETESEDSPPPSYTSALQGSLSGQKRRANEARLDTEEEFYDWDPTQVNESDLIQAEDNAPSTPHKAQKTGIYATPATSVRRKLPWMEEAQSESSRAGGKKNVTFLDTPSRGPTYVAPNDDPQTPVAPTTSSIGAKSPAPQSRYKDALSNPGDSQATLTNEALSALSTITIPPDILSKLRGILTKHDLRTQGVVKGRDISRLALKAKEAKIAELQAKIASLEAEQELQSHLRAVYGKSAEDEALSTQDTQTLQ